MYKCYSVEKGDLSNAKRRVELGTSKQRKGGERRTREKQKKKSAQGEQHVFDSFTPSSCQISPVGKLEHKKRQRERCENHVFGCKLGLSLCSACCLLCVVSSDFR